MVPRAQCVTLLGISDRTFLRLEAEGCFAPLVVGSGRKRSVYDPRAVVRGYLTHVLGSRSSPRDQKDLAQAELTRFRLEKERRQVLPRTEVVRQLSGFLGTLKTRLLAMPSALVRAGICSTSAATALDAAIRSGLAELVDAWQNETDLLEAEPPEDDLPADHAARDGDDEAEA